MILLKDRDIEFTDESLRYVDDKKMIMHYWEDDLMRRKSEFICENGGDILELGFGMGISANYIQNQNINSHTICEIHPDIIINLKEWSLDKKNVIILEGDWYDNISKMGKYDGILFDTHDDIHYHKFFTEVVNLIAKPNCRVTWWNNLYREDNRRFEIKEKSDFEVIDVSPPETTYFNNDKYYMPKYIHK